MQELLASFQKNAMEEVRLSLTEYKGHQLVDLRVYFQPLSSGEAYPTKKGLTISVDVFPELKDAIVKVYESLEERDLLPEVEEACV